jgi:hypothetical protein
VAIFFWRPPDNIKRMIIAALKNDEIKTPIIPHYRGRARGPARLHAATPTRQSRISAHEKTLYKQKRCRS